MDGLVLQPYTLRPTGDLGYSPHSQLPAPMPMQSTYLSRHFYENTAKHLIKDLVRIGMNGLDIDLEKVAKLEEVLDTQLADVKSRLETNKSINDFLEVRYKKQIEEYKEDRKSKLRDVDHYIKPFKSKDMLHRSFFMNLYVAREGITPPTTELLPGVPKWPIKLVKKLATTRPILTRMLEGKLPSTNPIIVEAVTSLAKMKATLYNKSYIEQIYSPSLPYPEFNPNSSKQKGELFEMLGVKSENTTKAGAPKWDRKEVVRVNKACLEGPLKELTSAFIDQSFAGIIRSNFIEGFYNYTVDGKLHSNFKLFGAKTFRPTCAAINLLQLPSTGNIFATPVKECFVAPKGYLIAAIDLSALEQRVLASLADEETLIKLYRDNLDGHSVHAIYYFPEEISAFMKITGDITIDARVFSTLVAEGHKGIKAIRQKGKSISFGLQYGSHPPSIAKTLGCSLSEATILFDNYHNKLYPSVTRFREEQVVPSALNYGELHMGLGATIKTDDVGSDERTLVNSCSQFWSVITLLTVNKMHQLIDEAGFANVIKCTATVYDSIYFIVEEDPVLIKWLNDNIVAIFTATFIVDQKVPNLADLELSRTSWADLTLVPNNSSVEDIESILVKL